MGKMFGLLPRHALGKQKVQLAMDENQIATPE